MNLKLLTERCLDVSFNLNSSWVLRIDLTVQLFYAQITLAHQTAVKGTLTIRCGNTSLDKSKGQAFPVHA